MKNLGRIGRLFRHATYDEYGKFLGYLGNFDIQFENGRTFGMLTPKHKFDVLIGGVWEPTVIRYDGSKDWYYLEGIGDIFELGQIVRI